MSGRILSSRRSFLSRVGATTTIGLLACSRPARAMQHSDNDRGQYADPPGRPGRDYGRTGITDSDGGEFADAAGHGRGAQSRSGVTDSDGGRLADPAGNGRGERGHSGFSDSDSGRCADPAGYGRGGTRSRCPDTGIP
ncbi:hypothetical protein [Parasphingopyxis lamellibrachiae]|uniref:Uncharacterized protein n=1 Tax=Parasphingopyxis lamellibrachiae TaxID=680125 RepID=A0A3D9FIB3_9SPHN|nr:hypothetical protein [Parasphingopyxis lamellibrachiae]RED16826.1 hypothetical protein DFR46_1858 [Parasphingopyxis lamellibrachiae]